MKPRTSALKATIFGVDVHSGDVRGDAPAYALVILDDDDVTREVVSGRKLHRLIRDQSPDVIATDNVYELAADKDALIRFLENLPASTRLVQVTGAARPEPLSRVANRHDIPYGKQPMQEAEAAARLAAANVGYEVCAFGDTTRVKVSRGRSPGKGGWSADRYTRRIHGAVKHRTREVEAALEEAGLSYEKEVLQKYGGYANAIFHVEASPDQLPVSRERAGDVRIEIERERRDGIEFEPLATRRDYVIIGLDPGTTTGVAVVDIDGNVLDVISTRTADTAEIIEWIIDHGRPFMVAADVTPMPETVEKIRQSFDAAAWTPETDLLIDRKQHRTRSIGYDNDHERDAAAAALFAFDDHASQFERIASRVPPQLDTEELIARVIRAEESIEAVLTDMLPDQEVDEPSPPPEQHEPSPEQRRIAQLESRVDRMSDHIEQLEATIEEKDDRIDTLEGELTEHRREERRDVRERREVTRLQRETQRLRRERERWREEADALDEKLERLKTLWRLDHSNFSDVEPDKRGLVPVKPIEKFTIGAIEAADADFGLASDEVILLRDASGAGLAAAERLAELEPRAIIKDGGLSDVAADVLFEADIPVGDRSEVQIQEVDELAVAREADVDAIIERWEMRARERRRDRRAALVDRVISEHRAERISDTAESG